MQRKKETSARPSAKAKGLRGSVLRFGKIGPDDAPEFTEAMLARAEIREGDCIVRRGRPSLGEAAKQAVKLRLSPTVLDAYRATGKGWQSRINADLEERVAKGLKTGTGKP